MSDRLLFALAGGAVLAILGLALVWPQGLGARSPPPFGHALGPIESEAPPAKKALRKRTPSDVAPGALTAPIPVARVDAPAPAPAPAHRPAR